MAGEYRSLTPIVSVEAVESEDVRRKESRDSFLLVSGNDCFKCCFRFLGPSGRVLRSKYEFHCSGLISGGGLDLEAEEDDLFGRERFRGVLWSLVLGLDRRLLTDGAELIVALELRQYTLGCYGA